MGSAVFFAVRASRRRVRSHFGITLRGRHLHVRSWRQRPSSQVRFRPIVLKKSKPFDQDFSPKWRLSENLLPLSRTAQYGARCRDFRLSASSSASELIKNLRTAQIFRTQRETDFFNRIGQKRILRSEAELGFRPERTCIGSKLGAAGSNHLLHDCVPPGCLAVPRGAKLRCAFLCFEIHVHQSEPSAEAIRPLEIVHRAPVKVAFHRNPFRSDSLQTDSLSMETAGRPHRGKSRPMGIG